jgi:RNA polymerase primary sigma factor
VNGLLSKCRKAGLVLTGESGREPTLDQLSESLGLTRLQRAIIVDALRSRRLSRDAPDDEGGLSGHPAAGDLRPEAGLEDSDEHRSLRALIEGRLGDRERELIGLRFGLGDGRPQTLKEIGRRLGITKEWARKIEERAILKLQVGCEDARCGSIGPSM